MIINLNCVVMFYVKNLSSIDFNVIGNVESPLKGNILPERYNSISKISSYPIVSPELNSQTELIHVEQDLTQNPDCCEGISFRDSAKSEE